jgi:hypothetical protein
MRYRAIICQYNMRLFGHSFLREPQKTVEFMCGYGGVVVLIYLDTI